MTSLGLQKGDEIVVTVRINQQIFTDIVVKVIGKNEVEAKLFIDGDEDLLRAKEAIAIALSSIDYKLELPHLRKMVERRIAELREADDEAGREDPPAPLIDDIPF